MNDKKTSEQVMREGLENIVFFSQGCYPSEYFANIAKKALEESDRLKLSIPKKVAEELDGFNPNEGETKIELLIVGYYKSFLSDELMSFCLADNGLNLCAFYLAGKALGVELVEVER